MAELHQLPAREHTGLMTGRENAHASGKLDPVTNDYETCVKNGHAGNHSIRQRQRSEGGGIGHLLLPIDKNVFPNGNIAPIIRQEWRLNISSIAYLSDKIPQQVETDIGDLVWCHLFGI